MRLNDIVRQEIDTEGWKEKPELVKRTLIRLNHLHADAVQKVLLYESQIREAGGEPIVEVVVTFPKPPPMPEPEPEKPQ